MINYQKSQIKSQVWVVENDPMRSHWDHVATEEPLEIRLVSPSQTIAVTMRTPGADFDLTAGFLYSEGVINHREDIRQMSYCVTPDINGGQQYNIVKVDLRSGYTPPLYLTLKDIY